MKTMTTIKKLHPTKCESFHVPVHRVCTETSQYQQSETTPPHKKSRKSLTKENQRLIKENDEIVKKFNELEELSVKKIIKLKEKLENLLITNQEITNENQILKTQSQDLQQTINELNQQLEITKQCRKCDKLKITLENSMRDQHKLKTTNHDLNEDLNMLKTVVYRLNLQLERYQDKIRQFLNVPNVKKQVFDDVDGHQDHSHTPISWGNVNRHTLGPLLDAYQDTINEKDEIIQNYEREFADFTGKLKDVIKENQQLHQALTDDEQSSTGLKNEINQLKTELKTLRQQNDLLIKKCALKQDKLDETLKCYELKIDQMKRDYTVVYDEFQKARRQIEILTEKNQTFTQIQDEFRNNYIPKSIHSSSVNECKQLYEELKQQYKQEKTKLTSLIDDQQKKIADLTENKEELQDKIKQLEKYLKKNEIKIAELEHNLNETQQSRNACRKQLHKAMNFAKDLVVEQETLLKALNQRHMENKVVKKIGSEMATRMDTLKNQLKDVQRDAWQELTTVEQRIEQQQNTIETMKQQHNQEIERLKNIIKEQQENLLLKEQTPMSLPQYLLFRDKYK